MPTLLHIDSSPSPFSVSRELTAEFVRVWKSAHPNGRVMHRDLAADPPARVDAKWIVASAVAVAMRSQEQQAALAWSHVLIGELEEADEYVLGVAMHNFSIPSVLKLWIDQVVLRGRTFKYSEAGPEGLLKGKKATIVVASGGIYEPKSPAAALNYVEPYLTAILSFIGVRCLRFIRAGGAAALATGTVDRSTFLEPFLGEVRTAASENDPTADELLRLGDEGPAQ
ncbi:MAG: NAD(P)H-dependent oxidoreductase [Bryobacteraceae bacterium]|nr:NAD(P)H-dependent oxidoreductase [Bryobacteraceae bacterium]